MAPTTSPDISVILTTSDRPEALACVLEGYRKQAFRDFEIVVGDDGSDGRTAEVIARYEPLLPGLVHVWQERRGHGRTRAINAAVRASLGRYLVFSDGDCVPEPDFLAVHAERRKPGCFLNGRRLMLEQEWEHLSPAQVASEEHRAADVSRSWSDIGRLRWKSRYYRLANLATGGLFWSRLRLLGANFSMWRDDFEAANGFDEAYVGWGTADEDLRRRLHDLGLSWRDAMAEALVWHIPHPPTPTKPRKIRQGRNVSRYNAWRYLVQPAKGLLQRPPEGLRLVAAGEAAATFEPLALSAGPKRPRPDAEIFVSGGKRASRPGLKKRARLRVGAIPADAKPENARRDLLAWRGKVDVLAAPPRLRPLCQEMGLDCLFAWDEDGRLKAPSPGAGRSEWLADNRRELGRLILDALRSDTGGEAGESGLAAASPALSCLVV